MVGQFDTQRLILGTRQPVHQPQGNIGILIIVDFNAISGATITVDGTALVEGTDWDAVSDNETAASNLATAIEPAENTAISEFYKIPLNAENFFMEAHAKLRPVDFATDGIFLCGLAHYPKAIDESIAQAMAAARSMW